MRINGSGGGASVQQQPDDARVAAAGRRRQDRPAKPAGRDVRVRAKGQSRCDTGLISGVYGIDEFADYFSVHDQRLGASIQPMAQISPLPQVHQQVPGLLGNPSRPSDSRCRGRGYGGWRAR